MKFARFSRSFTKELLENFKSDLLDTTIYN